MKGKLHSLTALTFAGTLLSASRADFSPIPLAPESFNHDVVVEKEAIHSPVATSASMDEGTANTAFGWYETGYNLNAPETGLPAAGSTVTSAVAPDHSYTFAANYTAKNALLVDTNTPVASLTLTTPSALAAISLLTSAGHGPVTNTVVVYRANGTSETNTFVAPDWFGSNAAVTANGRIDVVSLGFANVGSGNPNLYSADVPLTASSSPVTRVEIRNGSTGNGHTAVFAVSGAAAVGGEFAPLAVSGFNQDLIVESTASQPLTSVDATTASMDGGIGNTGASWYERGYNTNAPTTGLPPSGTTVTNATAPDHRYTMSATYSANNAALVDAENSASIRFATPANFSTLSFLTSAGSGSPTISYTVNFEDGSTEAGTFVSPDWFGGQNAAFVANGRVNVQSGLLEAVNSGNPRLYSVDVSLTHTGSRIASIDLALASGNGHAAIFAVSGSSGNVAPLIATPPASARVLEGQPAEFTASVSGTLPISYTWQVETNGAFVNLQNGAGISGANTATLSFNSATLANNARYRLAVTNVAGSAFSLPATLTVLSSAENVLSPFDAIEIADGTAPAAEGAEHAIDQDTAKYLNFGTGDASAPFTGPVGFVVTPTLGSDVAGTVVRAIRIFTANDAPERDPSSFTLEGSNNGTDFTQIAGGTLTLPDARNASGAPIDPLAQNLQEVRFANSIPFKTYRVLFQNVRNNAGATSVQVAEIQLLGTVATQGVTSLQIARNGNGTLTITSSSPGTLQSTTRLADAGTVWTDEGPINGSVTVTPTGNAKFYRVVAQQ